MKKGCGCLGVGLLVALGWIVAISMSAAGRPSAPATPKALVYQIVQSEEATMPRTIRVGQAAQMVVKLRNDGETAPETVGLQISGLFDGLILHSTFPNNTSDRISSGSRFFNWAGLPPGEERTYTLNLVGKTAGEYRYNLSILADRETMKALSGRVVVLP